MSKRRRETRLLHYGRQTLPGPANPPVVRASTILHDSRESYDDTKRRRDSDDSVLSYGRRGTTTAHALAAAICDLEGGDGCWLFPTGVAAIATTLQAFLRSGDHLLVAESVFHATRTVCESMLEPNGVAVETIPWDADNLDDWVRPATKAVFVESPGSDTFEIMDLPAICQSARQHGVVAIADNTYGSGWLYRPLELGCDVSIIAGTKYLSGHADVMMGSATARGDAATPLRNAVLATGQTLAPDEAYATLRGMRTLHLRLERHAENALRLVDWFQQQDVVQRVLHPALPGHPGHATWERDACGSNGLFTVIFDKDFALDRFLDAQSLFSVGSSWGGFESLLKPAALRDTVYTGQEMGEAIRFHAGLEHIDDLLEDLERSMAATRG